MSKSLGNCIYLSDEEDVVKKKIMSMFTDPNHLRVQDPGRVEGNPVFIYLDAFSRPEHFAEFLPEYQNLDELKAHYQRGGLGDVKVKKFLNNVMQAELGPIRERRKMWEQRTEDVFDILKAGTEVAREKAAATLHESVLLCGSIILMIRISLISDRKQREESQACIQGSTRRLYSGLIFFENYVTIAFIWETDVQLFQGRSLEI